MVAALLTSSYSRGGLLSLPLWEFFSKTSSTKYMMTSNCFLSCIKSYISCCIMESWCYSIELWWQEYNKSLKPVFVITLTDFERRWLCPKVVVLHSYPPSSLVLWVPDFRSHSLSVTLCTLWWYIYTITCYVFFYWNFIENVVLCLEVGCFTVYASRPLPDPLTGKTTQQDININWNIYTIFSVWICPVCEWNVLFTLWVLLEEH